MNTTTTRRRWLAGVGATGLGWALGGWMAWGALPLLPEEEPLWPAGFANPIHYAGGEQTRAFKPSHGSPSGRNRVFRSVAVPTFSLHRAPADVANGVGLVICPGGGFRDVWLDREGHDLALRLKPRGVTSLVLKYRTNTPVKGDQRPFDWTVYQREVIADARQAIRVLRSRAQELGVDPAKIGICGFSAGGHLAFNAVFRPEPPERAGAVSGTPNFAGLFYPGFPEDAVELVRAAHDVPPLFVINAIDDRITPVKRCLAVYQEMLKADVSAELHLFNRGGHGFDLGTGRSDSAALWPESFLAWLQDRGFTQPPRP